MDKHIAEGKYAEADALCKAGRYDKALVLLDELLAAYPAKKSLLRARMLCLAKAGRVREALPICDHLIREYNDARSIEVKQELWEQLDAARAEPAATPRPPRTFRNTKLAALLVGFAILAVIGLLLMKTTLDNVQRARVAPPTKPQVDTPQVAARSVPQAVTPRAVTPPEEDASSSQTPKKEDPEQASSPVESTAVEEDTAVKPPPAPTVDLKPEGVESALSYVRAPDRRYEGRSYESPLKGPPSSGGLPRFNTPRPVFILKKLGDADLLFAFDANSGAPFYNRLYIDTNLNGQLADETPIAGSPKVESAGRRRSCEFNDIDLSIPIDGKTFPFCFSVRVYLNIYNTNGATADYTQHADRARVYFTSRCCYAAKANIAGSDCTVYLRDQNCNGRFDDKVRARQSNDMWRGASSYGDSVVLSGGTHGVTGFPLTHATVIGDRFFSLDVKHAADALVVRYADPGSLARLSLSFPAQQVILANPQGTATLALCNPVARVPVPEGTYRLVSYVAQKQGPQGDSWRLSAAGTAASQPVRVSTGPAALLQFCEPLLPTVRVSQMSRQRRILDFVLRGAGGEIVQSLDCLSGSRSSVPMSSRYSNRPAEPEYRIARQSGEILARGKFEYG